MTIRTLVSVCILLVSGSMGLHSQDHQFLTYTVADGLPQSQVYAMVEDERGYLWLGTQGGGLARFDGQNYLNIAVQDGLPSNYINALLPYKDQLWVGTQDGLALIVDRSVKRSLPLPEGSQNVTALAHAPGQDLWVGTSEGLWLYQIEGDQFVRKDNWPDGPVHVIKAIGNTILVGTDDGLYQLEGEELQHLALTDPVMDIQLSKHHPPVLLGFSGKMYELDATHLAIAKSHAFPFRNPQTRCFLGSNQRGWIGTQTIGIVTYNHATEKYERLLSNNGQNLQHIRAMLTDQNGLRWVASSGGGFARYLGQQFSRYTRADGLAGNRIYALTADEKGSLWVANATLGVAFQDSNIWQPFALSDPRWRVKCRALHTDRQGRIWVGTDGNGVAVIQESNYRWLGVKDGLPSGWIRDITTDYNGDTWIATYASGIYQVQVLDSIGLRGKVHTSFPDLNLTCLTTDPNGRVWWANRSGQLGFLGAKGPLDAYGIENGLPKVSINSLEFTGTHILAGTAGRGVYQANLDSFPLTFKPLPSAKSLTSSNVYLLHIDQAGQLWVGSEQGLDLLKAEGSNWSSPIHYGRNEGFLGIETTQNAVYEADNALWFGTLNGLMRYQAGEQVRVQRPPGLFFEQITRNHQQLPASVWRDSIIKLPYSNNHLGISFQSVDLAYPDQLGYQYRLISSGQTSDWSPIGQRREIDFLGLAPGHYHFEAKACRGKYDCGRVQELSFVVATPFWKKQWFWPLLIAGGTLLLSLLFWGILRRFRRQAQQKQAELELQNHLLSLEQKARQLQMNPHFIFNALNSIQGLVGAQKAQEAREQIGVFASLMRSILANSQKNEISLQEEIDTLNEYLQVEQFCRSFPIDYRITLADGIDPDELAIPPMLIQPFVENAIIHGLAHRPEGGQIKIDFLPEGDYLNVQIKDSGIGRVAAAEIKKNRPKQHQSTALAVTRERLQGMLPGLSPEKVLQIVDLYAEDGRPAGTSVRMLLPWREDF